MEKPLGDASVIVGEFPEAIVENGQAIALRRPARPTASSRSRARRTWSAFMRRKANGSSRGQRPPVGLAARFDDRGARRERQAGRPQRRCAARHDVRRLPRSRFGRRRASASRTGTSWRSTITSSSATKSDAHLPAAAEPGRRLQFYAVNGQRVGYLDTTPASHPQGTPMYKVEVHPPRHDVSAQRPAGLHSELSQRRRRPRLRQGLALFFDPPADGEYIVRIGDARGEGGPNFGYRLTVRPPRPDFTVSFNPTSPERLERRRDSDQRVRVNRIDGYDGPVAGEASTTCRPDSKPRRPSSKRVSNRRAFALYATPQAAKALKPLKLIARATIDGKEVVHEAKGGLPKVVEPGDLVTTDEASAS